MTDEKMNEKEISDLVRAEGLEYNISSELIEEAPKLFELGGMDALTQVVELTKQFYHPEEFQDLLKKVESESVKTVPWDRTVSSRFREAFWEPTALMVEQLYFEKMINRVGLTFIRKSSELVDKLGMETTRSLVEDYLANRNMFDGWISPDKMMIEYKKEFAASPYRNDLFGKNMVEASLEVIPEHGYETLKVMVDHALDVKEMNFSDRCYLIGLIPEMVDDLSAYYLVTRSIASVAEKDCTCAEELFDRWKENGEMAKQPMGFAQEATKVCRLLDSADYKEAYAFACGDQK